MLGLVCSAMVLQDGHHQGAQVSREGQMALIEYEPDAAFPGVIGRTADESTPGLAGAGAGP